MKSRTGSRNSCSRCCRAIRKRARRAAAGGPAPATLTYDGTAGVAGVAGVAAGAAHDVDLLDAGGNHSIKFNDVASTLILRNTDANADGRRLVFILQNHLDPQRGVADNAATGIIQLDAQDANSRLVLTSNGGKTLGVVGGGGEGKIAQLNITGKGKVVITGKTQVDPAAPLGTVINNVDLSNVKILNVTKYANLEAQTSTVTSIPIINIGANAGAGAGAATLTIDGTEDLKAAILVANAAEAAAAAAALRAANAVPSQAVPVNADINLLNAGTVRGGVAVNGQQFLFQHADSTLVLSNKHDAQYSSVTFILNAHLTPYVGGGNAKGTGIIELNAEGANTSLILRSKDGNVYKLGTDGLVPPVPSENIKQLNITGSGKVTINGRTVVNGANKINSVDLTHVKEINIKKGANLILETKAFSGVDMNIGEAGVAANKGTLTIDGTQALTDAIAAAGATANVDIDLLTANGVRGAAAEQFKFLNEDSTLILSSKHATAGKTVTFKLNANLNPNNGSVNPNGTGIIELNAEDGNSQLILTSSAGVKTLGTATTAGEKIKQLNITGGGIVNIFGGANYVNLSNVKILNVINGANLISGTKTVAAIPSINIGAAPVGGAAGQATLTIDVSADVALLGAPGDYNIDLLANGGVIRFKHLNSTLILSNKDNNAANQRAVFTLNADLNPVAGGARGDGLAGGKIELNAQNGNSTLVLTSNGGAALGVDTGGADPEERIAQLNITGNGKVIITGGANSVDLSNLIQLNVKNGANLTLQTNQFSAVDMRIGEVAGNSTLNIDGTVGVNDLGGAGDHDIDLLDNGGVIRFENTNSTLILSNLDNTAEDQRAVFKLNENFDPLGGGVARGDGNATGIIKLVTGDAVSTIVLTSVGNKTLGGAGGGGERRIAQLDITGPGKVFITGSTAAGSVNNVDLQYVSKLNVTKAANLIAETDSIAKIPVIDIGTTAGAGPGKATVTIDGTEALKAAIVGRVPTAIAPINADIDLLNAGTDRGGGAVPGQQFLFEHKESTLILSNKHDQEYTSLTFILNENLNPNAAAGDAGGTGIVELNAEGANSTLIFRSANGTNYTLGTKTAGRAHENILELNITGSGKVKLVGDDPAVGGTKRALDLKYVKALNIKKDATLVVENQIIFTTNDINVGVAAGPDAGGGNLIVSTIIAAIGVKNIDFKHNDSTLTFSNTKNDHAQIILANTLVPINDQTVLKIESTKATKSLTVIKLGGGEQLGTGGGPVFKEINTSGLVIVNTKAYATTLNVASDTATFANTLGTTTINIGTKGVVGPPIVAEVDAALVLKNVDQTINALNFKTADSELKLYNENPAVGGADIIITLNNAITGAVNNQGKVELKADNKKLTIAGGGKFGDAGKRLKEFNVAAGAGAGEIEIGVDVYAKEVFFNTDGNVEYTGKLEEVENLSFVGDSNFTFTQELKNIKTLVIGANPTKLVKFNNFVDGGAGSILTFFTDSKIEFDKGVTYETIDFDGQDGEIKIVDGQTLEAFLKNGAGSPPVGEVIFAGKGRLKGPDLPDPTVALPEPWLTFYGAVAEDDRVDYAEERVIRQVTLKTPAAEEFTVEGVVLAAELVAEQATKINFEDNAILVGNLNKSAGGKVNLNFLGFGVIFGEVGRAGGAIGDITIQGNNHGVRLSDDVYATNIGFTGNGSRVVLNEDLTLDGALDLTDNGIEIENNIVFTGNLRGKNPTFYVNNEVLDYHGDAAFTGEFNLITEITPVDEKSVGRIVVKAGKFDLSDVDKFIVTLDGATSYNINYSRIDLVEADGGEVVRPRNSELKNLILQDGTRGPYQWVLDGTTLESIYVAQARMEAALQGDPQGNEISSTMGGQDQEPGSDAASMVDTISDSTPEEIREGVNDQMNVVSQDTQVVQDLAAVSIPDVIGNAVEGSIGFRMASFTIPLDGGFLTPDITPTFNIEPGPSVIVPTPLEGGTPAAGPSIGGTPATSPAVGGATRENNATPAGGAGTPAGGRTAPTREQRRNEQNAEVMGVAAGDMVGARLGFWGSPFYNKTTRKQKGFTPGNNATSKGGTIGIDTLFNEDTLVGAAFTFANTKINYKGEKEGDNTKVNTYMLSVYGLRTLPKNFYVQTILSFSQSNIDHKEYRSFVKNTSRGKYDLNSYGSEVLFGYNHRLNMFSAITPTLCIRYTKLNQSEFTETGAVGTNPITGRSFTANMRYPSQSSQKLDGMIGMRIMGVHAQNEVTFLPEMHVQYAHDFIAKEKKSKAYLQGQAKPQPTRPVKPESNFFNVGGGINIKYHISEFGLGYELTTAKKMMSHQGMFKLRVNI